jgi:prepilin-type N-terminal cleavage/methylation domain-containing protein
MRCANRQPRTQAGRDKGLWTRGFTLIETALAVVIVGTGVVATMQLFSSCTRDNQAAVAMTSAVMLSESIGEVTQGLPFSDPQTGRSVFGAEPGETQMDYDDVDDFDQQSFNPPIDAQRNPISDLAQFTQLVTVVPVLANDPDSNTNETDISRTAYTGAVRVKVRVLYRVRPTAPVEEVYRTSWLRYDR